MDQERRRTPCHPLGRQEHPCLVKDYSDGGVRRMASKSRMTFRCSSRPTNQLEAVVIGWFGDWEGTWVLNLLAPRPSPTDTMPRHDLQSPLRFWHCAAIPAG